MPNPDFEYIRKRVPVLEVARALDLRISGNAAHCWRVEGHQYGDRTPSITFKKRINRWQCMVCDSRPWSPIDLVALRRNCSLRSAAIWIAANFDVPDLPKGQHIKKRDASSLLYRASEDEGDTVAMLVRSGLWRTLSHAERSILPVLCTFLKANGPNPTALSYRAIMAHAGVGSMTTVSSALKSFQQMGLLRVVRGSTADSLRTVNRYQLTADDDRFRALAGNAFREAAREAEAAAEFRAKQRSKRAAERGPPT